MKRRFRGKFLQYNLLKSDEELSHFLPETFLFTEEWMWNLLEREKQVIIKPCIGRLGRGVIQITAKNEEEYELHVENVKLPLNDREQLKMHLREHYFKKKKRYIVQQKISLATINECPFDLRVMVQRKEVGFPWEVTGRLVKVASKGFVITNVAKAILPLEKAIQNSSIRDLSIQDLIAEIDRISLRTAVQFEGWNVKKLGLDIGIDQKGNLWIIEVNTKPATWIFKMLPDKTMYQKIKKYHLT